MDNSISKALIMVASVLLAMIVIAFLTFTMRRTGDWATTQDDKILAEQKDKFNKEYEAFDKDLMYGVDVISCLNKAKSNNKQIEEKGYVTGEKYDTSYHVDVKFTLNSALTENITVYHMSETGNGKEIPYEGIDDKPNTNKVNKLEDVFSVSASYASKIPGGTNKITFSNKLETYKNGTTKIDEGDYNLVGSKSGLVDALLTCSDTLKQTVKNKDKETSSATDGWTKAVWETALYDMKTRKFTCEEIKYNATTGRVNYLHFSEI